MSNFVEFNDKIAFHPGYYIKELVEESYLTREDYARLMDIAPETLSTLINGDQNLSAGIALKLARMLGTSETYWLNLQQSYDEMKAVFLSNPL